MGLFKPAWASENDKRAVKAVNKLTDQTILTDLARNNKSVFVRKAAVEKLTDQSILADIARNDKNPTVSRAAIEKITDQILAKKLLAEYNAKIKASIDRYEAENTARKERRRQENIVCQWCRKAGETERVPGYDDNYGHVTYTRCKNCGKFLS
jgi:geranylgeranyl pyrophosphate synthase